jgi:arsenite methyltransferase
LGSGAGIDVFISAEQVGLTGKAIGLDMTDEMLERADQNRKKLGIQNAEFRKGEIEDMPVQSSSIDAIVSNCVLNLVPEKRKAFAEMFRVLKQGGAFTVSDIVTEGIITDEYRNDPLLWSGCVSGAVEKSEYLRIIHEAGFHHIEVVDEKAYAQPAHVPFTIRSITVRARK